MILADEWIVGEKAKNRTAYHAEVDEDSFFVAVVGGYTTVEKIVARTRRVIGHRVAILEHAETDADGERGDGRVREAARERMDRESERGRATKEMKKDAESEAQK